MKLFKFVIITALFAILPVACTTQEVNTDQTREDYRQEIWARWDQLNKQIEELGVEAEKVKTEASVDELAPAIDDLMAQHNVANEQLQELEVTIGEAWQVYRPEIDRTLNELEQVYKELYQQVAAARIEQVEKQIEELRVEAEQTDAADKPELEATIGELEAQRDVAIERLELINTASVAAWKDLRTGLEAALIELEEAYQQARSRFEETG